jgi:hemoglobin
MQDIETRNDIETLINVFYDRLFQINELKEVFEGINIQLHVPHIVDFWAFVLLDHAGYTANVFQKHVNLPIKTHHFEMWLDVFTKTVNDLFVGEKAALAIQRATVLAFTFKSKWQHLKD